MVIDTFFQVQELDIGIHVHGTIKKKLGVLNRTDIINCSGKIDKKTFLFEFYFEIEIFDKDIECASINS